MIIQLFTQKSLIGLFIDTVVCWGHACDPCSHCVCSIVIRYLKIIMLSIKASWLLNVLQKSKTSSSRSLMGWGPTFSGNQEGFLRWRCLKWDCKSSTSKCSQVKKKVKCFANLSVNSSPSDFPLHLTYWSVSFSALFLRCHIRAFLFFIYLFSGLFY